MRARLRALPLPQSSRVMQCACLLLKEQPISHMECTEFYRSSALHTISWTSSRPDGPSQVRNFCALTNGR